MVTQAGKDCLRALCTWEPDAAWQRPKQGYSGGNSWFRYSSGEETKDPIRQSVLALRDQFIHILQDVPDPEEQENLIALFYSRVRCQWLLLNTQSGYQIAEGKIDRDIYYHSGLLSDLLKQLEWFIDPADVSQMTNFLTRPTRSARTTVDRERTVMPVNLSRVHLEREADAARTERAILETELGFSDASAVLEHIQDMKKRLAAMEDIQFMLGSLENTVSFVNV